MTTPAVDHARRWTLLVEEGSAFVGRCPAGHDEGRSPSFSVHPDVAVFYCFNGGEKGKVADMESVYGAPS